MTCAELYQLMSSSAHLSEKTLPELKQIVADFPYFHAARMLYLKNLAILDDIRLKIDLKKMAIHIPDRMKLFMLLEGEQYAKPVEERSEIAEKSIKKESKFNLVESFLSTSTVSGKKEKSEEPLIIEPPTAGDYMMQWFLHDEPQPEKSDSQLQHQDLIDSFIKNDSERVGKRLDLASSFDEDEKNDMENDSSNQEKEALDMSYFTETLAHVYIRQKRYDKALEIIKNLSLKYPEKNIYFADQIRFLEKLIIHSKK